MNTRNWKDAPIAYVVMKLQEEAAEVGHEFTEAWKDGAEWDAKAVAEECDHVIALARIIKQRAKASF